jgi:DNA-binding response OmpR family regulator
MSSDTPGEVLIVDADASIRGLLSALVQRIPRKPVAAADGKQALDLLEASKFEAVILDLLVPEVSGHDVLAWLAERSPQMLPHVVVLTTGKWTPTGELAKVAAVLRKPFAIDELLAALALCSGANKSGDRLHESNRPPEDQQVQ